MGSEKISLLQNITDAPWLLKPHVHMKNPENVLKKINHIVHGGKTKLQIIFDFDRTLTKHHHKGVVTRSSFGVLENLPYVPKGFRDASIASLEKYRPIETDPNMTTEEKIPYMIEWWGIGIKLLKDLQWDPEVVDECIKQDQQPYRDGIEECFQWLQGAGVPVLVFSAGIGDVVKALLVHRGLLTPNVHIVSNFLKFKDGKIVGYVNDTIIHVFNKNEQIIENTPYFEELKGRSNVILLGDSSGDATMADGVPHDTVLKIGFLNSNIEASLTQYMDLFDIVLADDQTMDVLSNILKPTLL